MSELSPSVGPTYLQGGESVSSPSPLAADPPTPEEPPSPESRYLGALASGKYESTARAIAGWSTDDYNRARARDSEFAALADYWAQMSIMGRRPELARLVLAHDSLTYARRLRTESETAPHARDRIHAAQVGLDHGPLAPRVEAAGTTPVQINVVINVVPNGQPAPKPTVIDADPA